MSKNQTIVEFKGSEIAINNDNYYNAQSIKLNPTAALIIPVFIVR